MNKAEEILALGNALIMLEKVSAEGSKNWNALLVVKQQISNVYKDLKEEEKNENRADA